MTNNDIVAELFGISPMLKPGEAEKNMIVGSPEVLPQVQEDIQPPTPEQIIKDFDAARKNVLEVIDTGKKAFSDLADLADQSQDNKYYDSLTSALKVMLEANRDLVDMQSKIQELVGKVGGAVKQVQNNLFIGSTSELQQMLEDLKKKGN